MRLWHNLLAMSTLDVRRVELGRKLKMARERANRARKKRRQPLLTQTAVAKHFGFDQSAISRIESGRAGLGFLEVEELANFYGVEYLDELRTFRHEERKGQIHFDFRCKECS
jgi:transcriptional regulator with XRE-family HTH domain